MQKQVVVVSRFWTVGILATVLIFGQVTTNSPVKRFSKKKNWRPRSNQNPTSLNRRLMNSESGSRKLKRG